MATTLTDSDLHGLENLADSRGVPLGATKYELVSKALRRANGLDMVKYGRP